MNDQKKNKQQLLQEIRELRSRLKKIESSNQEREYDLDGLQGSIDLYRALVDSMLDATIITDWDGIIIFANKAVPGLIELCSTEDVVGMNILELVQPEFREQVTGYISKVRKGRGGFLAEYKIITAAGKEKWVEGLGTKIRFQKSNAIRVTLRDITDRKEAETALRESEQKYRHLIQHSSDAIYLLYNHKFEIINDKFQEKFGVTLEDVNAPDFDFMELVAPESRPYIVERERRLIKGEELESSYQFTALSKNGQEMEVEASVSYIQYKDGIATQGILRDVTERKKAEDALRASEEKLKAMFESFVDGIFVTDLKGRLLEVNDSCIQMYGYQRKQEVLGESIYKFLKSEEWDKARDLIRNILRKGFVKSIEFVGRKKDGTEIPLELSGAMLTDRSRKPIGFVGNVKDITDRRRLKQQLLQSQKMEAIGRLAGGVAHDFNNLLTIIRGYTDFVLIKLSKKDSIFKSIEQINRAAERAEGLTRQLLAFSRKQVMKPEIINLNGVIEESEKMLRRLIGEDIELVTLLHPDLEHIKADPGQIEQVIMNLAVNARDAMPEGGKLTIETQIARLDEMYKKMHPEIITGPYVRLSISDTGVGIDRENQSRIFEPFFTTKPKGKGTGLGLSTIYGIIKQSNGFIYVYSEPGMGTTFKIYLPVVAKATDEKKKPSESGTSLQGTETILVVEDEDDVRKLVCQTLRFYGYQVLETENGMTALLTWEKYDQPIDLILTDMVMPQISGKQLIEKLNSNGSTPNVLYMSGYTDNSIVQHGILDPGTQFIQKPFSPKTLVQKVRRILDEAPS